MDAKWHAKMVFNIFSRICPNRVVLKSDERSIPLVESDGETLKTRAVQRC